MPRDHRLYLDDILEAIARIRLYVEGMDYELFVKDIKTRDAVVRNLEVIGEAARNLPDHLRKEADEIEWNKIIGLRNILAHAYFNLNSQIIWDVVQNKLLALETACRRLLDTPWDDLDQ